MVREILAEDAADVALGRAARRAVVVGEVKVADAKVEGSMQHLPGLVLVITVAEVVPAAE